MVWHIKGLCLGGLRISWYLVVLGVLRVLCLGLPCILGLEGKFLLCICLSIFVRLLKLLLMFAVPIFFCILADREIWSPSTSLWFWCCCNGVLLIWVLGFNLYLQFGICGSHGVVGGGNGPILPQFKRLPDIYPALGQGVLAQTVAFCNGGGLFSDVKGFWLSEFMGV